MAEVKHQSDCAVHNAPALPVGTCDCAGEVKHTQGSFSCDESGVIRAPSGRMVARAHLGAELLEGGKAKRLANARLLAAAPELKEIVEWVEQLTPLLRMITIKQVLDAGDDAISATCLNPWCVAEGLATGDEQAIAEWRIDAIRAALAKANGEGVS